MRAVGTYLSRESDSGVPIFVLSGHMAGPVQHYLGNRRAVYALPSFTQSQGASQALGLITSTTLAGKPYWLVYSRPFAGDPQGSILKGLQHRDQLRLMACFAGAVLYRGVRREKVAHESPEVTDRPKRSTS